MRTTRVGPGGGRRRRFAATTVPQKPPPTIAIVRNRATRLPGLVDDQLVAGADHGLQHLRRGGIDFDLLAQAMHELLEQLPIARTFVSPNLLEPLPGRALRRGERGLPVLVLPGTAA